MCTSVSLALVAAAATFVGTLQGLVGGGGGALYVIVLVLGTQADAAVAIGTGTAAAAVGAAVSAYGHHRAGNVDWARVGWFLPAGALAAVAAGQVARRIPDRVLLPALVVTFAVIAALPLRALWSGRLADGPEDGTGAGTGTGPGAPPTRHRLGRSVVGAVTGLTTGAFAISGGTLISSYLSGWERLTAARSVGTAIGVLAPICLASALGYGVSGGVSLPLLLLILPGAAGGGFLGSVLIRFIPTRVLAPALGVLTLGTLVTVVRH